jgi:iron-sulfur cluster repair protein YtfE (RIC family)
MSDPVRKFEHAHVELVRLALEVRDLVHAAAPGQPARKRLVDCLQALRDELLVHFANEEEGLFPFLRTNVPTKAETVDRLESAHDAICGSILRLAHLAAGGRDSHPAPPAALSALYERFEATFATHSQAEAALFEELGRLLDDRQRTALAELLRGL